jgi:hypothetical protein
MLRPQVFPRRRDAAPSVGARLAQIQMAADTGALTNDELRRAIYELVGLPSTYPQTPAARAHRHPQRGVRQARAS